jgi:hypothetical protein
LSWNEAIIVEILTHNGSKVNSKSYWENETANQTEGPVNPVTRAPGPRREDWNDDFLLSIPHFSSNGR